MWRVFLASSPDGACFCLPGAAAGVEHEPLIARAAHHRAGPGSQVVERGGCCERHGVDGQGPVGQVGRDGVAGGDVAVPPVRFAHLARGFEEVHVIGMAVIGESEVPRPTICQSQHCGPFAESRAVVTRRAAGRSSLAVPGGTASDAGRPPPGTGGATRSGAAGSASPTGPSRSAAAPPWSGPGRARPR